MNSAERPATRDEGAGLLVRTLDALRIKPAAKLMHGWMTRLGVPRVSPVVVRALSHDPTAFTQGLTYYEGYLYESTGTYGASSVRRIDPETGAVEHLVHVPEEFCEGIAQFNGRLYQLSWLSETARVYELPTLQMVEKRRYAGEAWGLTSCNGMLLMSNGSSYLRHMDGDFNLVREVRVTSHGIPIPSINDIEAVADTLLANVYGSTDILEIDLASGRLRRIVDCKQLASAAMPDSAGAVMNGIAYNPCTRSFYFTGKYWRILYEAMLP